VRETRDERRGETVKNIHEMNIIFFTYMNFNKNKNFIFIGKNNKILVSSNL
jgi:hypothetical protein